MPPASPSAPPRRRAPKRPAAEVRPPAEPTDEWIGRVELVADYLLDAGRVVPSLERDDRGRARSWWLPLPSASDRALLAGLVPDDTPDGHRSTAAALAAAVDRGARARLAAHGTRLDPPRPGRRTVPHTWLASLTADDPYLPDHLDPVRVDALAEEVATWVASGAANRGRSRLCLRIHEPGAIARRDPEDGPAASKKAAATKAAGTKAASRKATAATAADAWHVEVLLQDGDEPSLIVPIARLWAGRAPFPTGSVSALLAELGRVVTLAPELADLLTGSEPTGVDLGTAELLTFVQERVEPLAEIGVTVLLPSWWHRRARVGLRARATSGSSGPTGVVTEAGLDFATIVSFQWEAVLGERRLTKADLRVLERAAAAKQPLVEVRGEWVMVDPDELRHVIARAGGKGQTSVGGLVRARLGLRPAPPGHEGHDATTDLDDAGLGDEVAAGRGGELPAVTASGWLSRLLDDVAAASATPVPTPAGFDGSLRPYQERGVGWLSFLGRLGLGACLADDMGLGKTAQLIATVLADAANGPTLVVCPVSVLGNWARELARFAPGLAVHVHHGTGRHDAVDDLAGADVVLTTYALLARDVERLAARRWGRVVLDEAQQIKNPSTHAARAARALPADRRIALTGTPVENRLAELWSIMEFLNPGLLGSLAGFSRTFAAPIERDGDDVATARLQRRVQPFLLRRLKTDRSIIDDLPDKVEVTDRCVLSREQATLYQAVVDDLLAAADREEGIARRGAVLAGIARLKQVCNHPAHYLGDGSPLAGRSGKLDRVDELLDEIVDAGDKVLCFTQFAEWGERLVPYLARRYGTEPLWLHGGVTRKRRDEQVAAFADPDGPPIFLLSLKAGGTGLNLTAASHVIHLDRWWNPAVEDQATDRAYRIGQRRTVLVHKLVTAGTIEERIDEMIANKRALSQKVVGDGEAWLTNLDTAALAEVVRLRDGDVG